MMMNAHPKNAAFGKRAVSFVYLRHQGLQCEQLHGEPPAAHGVAGQASPSFPNVNSDSLHSENCSWSHPVVKENIPGANVDMQTTLS